MMPVEIDPSEVRRPRPDAPERARPRLGRPAVLAALAVVGVGGCAGLAAAAYPTISGLLRPRPAEVHFGRVADMPEIKDGVPALRATPAPVVRKVEIPPATPPVAPVALLDPKPAVPWSPASDVAATGTAASFQPAPAALPRAPDAPRAAVAPERPRTTEAAPPVQAETPAPKPVAAKPAAPKPPARDKAAEEKAPKPAPVREAAKAEPVKPAAPRLAAEKAASEKRPAEKPVARREKPEAHPRTAAAQPAAAPAAPPEEPTRFLGMPLPDLAPAGRAIKDTVDAVISFPSRL